MKTVFFGVGLFFNRICVDVRRPSFGVASRLLEWNDA
jgi:hypothetical protein